MQLQKLRKKRLVMVNLKSWMWAVEPVSLQSFLQNRDTKTGTDLTPDVITNSRILAKEEQVTCDFQVMDAEHLTFQDESFDVVISRNLTWTLPEAAQAYKEWSRVLKGRADFPTF